MYSMCGLVAALVGEALLFLVVWSHTALHKRADRVESEWQCCLYRLNRLDQVLEDLVVEGRPLPKDLASLHDARHSYYLGKCWDEADCLSDQWSQPVIYRFPAGRSGRFSKLPYELYSAGPNGRDELGYGDDVALGK